MLVERGMRRINGGIIKMRQEELFGWQITNGGLRNLRKKVENWKENNNNNLKKNQSCKLPYGIYAFKFGSLPNWSDDDWLDWGLFLFSLSSHSLRMYIGMPIRTFL
jgi:hypothetical protein